MGNPRLENVASQKFRSLLGSHQRLSSAACLLPHRMNVNNNPENDRKVRCRLTLAQWPKYTILFKSPSP